MSPFSKIQISVNLVLIQVFLFTNFFFYTSANSAFSAELDYQSELLIHDENQSITGDLFDLSQLSENNIPVQPIKDNTLSNAVMVEINHELLSQDLEILVHSKFNLAPKRPEAKIYLAIHAIKIP